METHHVFKSYSEVMRQLAAYFVHRRKFRRAAIDYTRGIIEAELTSFPMRRKKYFLSINPASENVTKIEVTVDRGKSARTASESRDEKIMCGKFYFLL